VYGSTGSCNNLRCRFDNRWLVCWLNNCVRSRRHDVVVVVSRFILNACFNIPRLDKAGRCHSSLHRQRRGNSSRGKDVRDCNLVDGIETIFQQFGLMLPEGLKFRISFTSGKVIVKYAVKLGYRVPSLGVQDKGNSQSVLGQMTKENADFGSVGPLVKYAALAAFLREDRPGIQKDGSGLNSL
jgi:hypothetical protein